MAAMASSWTRRRRCCRRSSSLSLANIMLPAVLHTLCLLASARAAWSILPQKRFRLQGLIDAGTLGLNDIGSGIVAWGDWNGDQYVDALTLSDDRRTVYLRLWDHAEFTYSSHPIFGISPSNGQEIINVVPADFDHDGHLDVLLMTQSSSGYDQIEMEVWLGKGTLGGAVRSKSFTIPASTAAQPMLVDGTGDMQLDLLGQTAAGLTSAKLQIWRNTFLSSDGSQAFEVADAPLLTDGQSGAEESCALADPHSSAFIDIDGDCLADLFLVCAATSEGRSKYQIWTAMKFHKGSGKDGGARSGGFVFSRSGYLPTRAGPLSFADMNRDGTTDVVFASCDSKDCYVNVVYNQQVGLCDKHATAAGKSTARNFRSWWDWGFGGNVPKGSDKQDQTDRCRKTEELCVADDRYSFDFDRKSNAASRLQVPFSLLGLSNHRPLVEDKLISSSAKQPISLVVGDFDKNGYPDLLLLSTPAGEPESGIGKTSVHILRNVPCSDLNGDVKARNACRADLTSTDDGRWFQVLEEGVEALNAIDDARSASWVDVDEDGSLDLMIMRGRKDDAGIRTVTFVQNNYFYDAFFLKALTLNGACASFCEGTDEGRGQHYRPWGASMPGASYKFTVLDPNGNRRAQQVGQSAQSNYRPLLPPYSYFGLGRTNNYVENLLVGPTLHAPRHVLTMEGVIPNSQVVISPYLDKNNDLDDADPSSWRRELYLKPGDWVPWVTLTLVTLIIGLCGFVFAMHVREKREDERERKRAVHAINFGALG